MVRAWRSRVSATRGCHPQRRSLPRARPLPSGGSAGALCTGVVQNSDPGAGKVSSALCLQANAPNVWVRSCEAKTA